MIKKGFKKVYYSTGVDDEIDVIKLTELVTRDSKSQKQFKKHGYKLP